MLAVEIETVKVGVDVSVQGEVGRKPADKVVFQVNNLGGEERNGA
jgi:hypothetical protein